MMIKWFLLSFLLLFAQPTEANGTIVLVVDISSSINDTSLELQYGGYERAMMNIGTLKYANIEVILFDSVHKHISSGNNEDAARAFASEPRVPFGYRGMTCLNKALTYVEAHLPTLDTPVIVDISGDGESNCSSNEEVHASLDRLANKFVRVNTLYIENVSYVGPDESLSEKKNAAFRFYQSLTRNGGFAIRATDFDDFEETLFRKLVLEIAQLGE